MSEDQSPLTPEDAPPAPQTARPAWCASPAELDMAIALDVGRLAGQRSAERQGRRFTAHDDDYAAAVNATLLVLRAAGLVTQRAEG